MIKYILFRKIKANVADSELKANTNESTNELNSFQIKYEKRKGIRVKTKKKKNKVSSDNSFLKEIFIIAWSLSNISKEARILISHSK